MDTIVNQHFDFEAADDVDGVMGTLADDAEHEVIPSPVGALTDRAKMRSYYERLFEALKGQDVTPVRRLYGDDFIIDETVWHGRINDGAPFLCAGKSGSVSFRLLHVFEVRGGKVKREQVWCDLASIQQQLGCTAS
jgi:ketosteroid isomerase-like protein